MFYYIYVRVYAGAILGAPTRCVFTDVRVCLKLNAFVESCRASWQMSKIAGMARFVGVFLLFVLCGESESFRGRSMLRSGVSNYFPVSDYSTSCVNNLLACHVSKQLNSANCSPVYRIAVQDAMTNSVSADFGFLAWASSGAYL